MIRTIFKRILFKTCYREFCFSCFCCREINRKRRRQTSQFNGMEFSHPHDHMNSRSASSFSSESRKYRSHQRRSSTSTAHWMPRWLTLNRTSLPLISLHQLNHRSIGSDWGERLTLTLMTKKHAEILWRRDRTICLSCTRMMTMPSFDLLFLFNERKDHWRSFSSSKSCSDSSSTAFIHCCLVNFFSTNLTISVLMLLEKVAM